MRARWLLLVPFLAAADWYPIELIADPAARSVELPARPAACYAMTVIGACGTEVPSESAKSNSVCRAEGPVTLSWQAPTLCVDGSPLASLNLWTIYTDTLPPQPRPAAPTLVRVQGVEPDRPEADMAYRLAGSVNTSSLDVTAKETSPRVSFDDSGTLLFVIGSSADAIHKYTLSTAWDVTTATFSQTYTIGGASNGRNPSGVHWKPDGTAFFTNTGYNDRVLKYTVSSAWDLTSTVTESQIFSVAGQTALPLGLVLSPDGTKLFVAGNDATDRVYSYTLGTAWDLSTASYDSVSLDISGQETAVFGLSVPPVGTHLYVAGGSGSVWRYSLSTAWDLSTASYASDSIAVTLDGGSPNGLYVNPEGNRFYVTDDGVSDFVYEFVMPSAAVYDPRQRQLEQLVLH